MKFILKLTLVSLLFLNTVNAQPSSSVDFSFRLFNNKGEVIAIEKFCTDFKVMQGSWFVDFCNEAYHTKQSIYNVKSKTIRLNLTTVYAPISLSIIQGVDTMVIYTINSGYGAVINVDSLTFKPGLFAIECKSRIINGQVSERLPELHLKAIDYTAAKVKYYNYLLEQYKELARTKLFNNLALIRFFRHAQVVYQIAKNDLNEKTAEQLITRK